MLAYEQPLMRCSGSKLDEQSGERGVHPRRRVGVLLFSLDGSLSQDNLPPPSCECDVIKEDVMRDSVGKVKIYCCKRCKTYRQLKVQDDLKRCSVAIFSNRRENVEFFTR